MRTEAVEGLRYVLGHRYLRNIAACTGTLNLFGNIGGVILLLYIVDELGINPGTVGLIFAIANIGVLLGALTAERLASRIGIGPTIVWSAFLNAFSLVVVAVAPRDNPVPFLIASGVIGAGTSVIYNVNQVSLRQAITPERMLGRMNATMRFIVWGTMPIGSLVGGVLGAAHRPAGDDLGRRHRIVPRLPARPLQPGPRPAPHPRSGPEPVDARGADALLGVGRGAGRADDRHRRPARSLAAGRGPQCLGLARRARRARRGPRGRRQGAPACGCSSFAAARATRPPTSCVGPSWSIPAAQRHGRPHDRGRGRAGRAARRRRSSRVRAPLADPILLVCTNGKRDACCALRGRALMTALAADHAERTWECTHLGGHRFAGNLVCLPHGIVYGRVPSRGWPAPGRRVPRRQPRPGPAPRSIRLARARPGGRAGPATAPRPGGLDDVELVEPSLDGDRASVELAACGRGASVRASRRALDRRGRPAAAPTSWRSRSTGWWSRRSDPPRESTDG